MNQLNETNSYSIKLPEYRNAKIELFKFLNLNDLSVLLTCFNVENDTENEFINEQPKIIKSKSNEKQNEYKSFSKLIAQQLNWSLDNKKSRILIDKYFYLFKFSLENLFNKEQISCLLTIAKKTHDLAVDTSFGNLDETFDYFKKSLLIHAVHRPPFSLQLFTTKQLELVFEYMFSTYFKQFKFYKYVFSDAIKLNLKFNYSNKMEETEVLDSGSALNLDVNLAQIDEISAEQEQELQQQKRLEIEKNDLKEFIRNYLGNQLDKMKREITSEFNMANEQNKVKPISAKQSPKVTKSAKKK